MLMLPAQETRFTSRTLCLYLFFVSAARKTDPKAFDRYCRHQSHYRLYGFSTIHSNGRDPPLRVDDASDLDREVWLRPTTAGRSETLALTAEYAIRTTAAYERIYGRYGPGTHSLSWSIRTRPTVFVLLW